jgi:hypothetical protein
MKNYACRICLIISSCLLSYAFCLGQDYIKCADENGKFYLESKSDVAYGADGKFFFKTGVSGWIIFDNATFGDPIPGVFKSGYYKKSAEPTVVVAPPLTEQGVRIFEHGGYGGAAAYVREFDAPELAGGWDNIISSVQVPEGYRFVGYDYQNYQGDSIEIIGNWTLNEDNKQWNDRISSFRWMKISTPDAIPIKTDLDPIIITPDNTNAYPPTNQYLYCTNKIFGEQLDLGFDFATKAIAFGNSVYTIKLLPVNEGHWQKNEGANNLSDRDPDGRTRAGYKWVNEGTANLFKILLQINGKYWALSSKQDASILLAEQSSDQFQSWEIDRLPDDGYFRITNRGLKGTANPYLFCDPTRRDLFMAGGTWDESKSLNGRWRFLPGGDIPANELKDELDNKSFSLTSSTNSRSLKAEYVQETDSYSGLYFSPSDNPAQFFFKRAINGQYLIGTTLPGSGNLFRYLNHGLDFYEGVVDVMEPPEEVCWHVTKIGDTYWTIDFGPLAMEMVQLTSRATIQIRNKEHKLEQWWILK